MAEPAIRSVPCRRALIKVRSLSSSALGKRVQPAGMRMHGDHHIAPRRRAVDGRFHILARPGDEIAAAGAAVVRHRDDFAAEQFFPASARLARTATGPRLPDRRPESRCCRSCSATFCGSTSVFRRFIARPRGAATCRRAQGGSRACRARRPIAGGATNAETASP